MSPRQLFRALALAETVTWTLLLAGMAQKYLLDAGEWGVSVAGALHGFVFLAFVVAALLVAVNQRWSPRVTLLALASAVPPLATLPAEWWLERTDRLDGGWRRADDPDGPPQDRLLGLVLARPGLAAAVAGLGVAVVFAGLLVVGPPGGGSGAEG